MPLYVLTLGAILIGCKGRDIDWDKFDRVSAVSRLNDIVEKPWDPEYQERANAALRKFNDEVLNTTPILIMAILTLEDSDESNLWIVCFDEGRDLRGIRVREQHEGASGVTTPFEEDYPIFAGDLKPFTVERLLIPIKIRDEHQRKDELSWLQYENCSLNALIQEIAADGKKGTSGGFAPRLPVPEMPPIYISIPDPNHVRVQVCAYDRAGQGSEWIDIDVRASPPPGKSQ